MCDILNKNCLRGRVLAVGILYIILVSRLNNCLPAYRLVMFGFVISVFYVYSVNYYLLSVDYIKQKRIFERLKIILL